MGAVRNVELHKVQLQVNRNHNELMTELKKMKTELNNLQKENIKLKNDMLKAEKRIRIMNRSIKKNETDISRMKKER